LICNLKRYINNAILDLKNTTDNLHKYAKKISDETSQKIDEHSLGKVKFFSH